MAATESDAQQRYLSMVSRSQVGQRTPSGSTEFDTEGLKPLASTSSKNPVGSSAAHVDGKEGSGRMCMVRIDQVACYFLRVSKQNIATAGGCDHKNMCMGREERWKPSVSEGSLRDYATTQSGKAAKPKITAQSARKLHPNLGS